MKVIRPAACLLATALVGAATLAGCSSNPGTPTGQWATAYCGALKSWVTGATAAFDSYETQMKTDTNPVTVKQATSALLTQELASTDRFTGLIAKAGNPAVPNGAAVTTGLTQPFDAYRAVIVHAQAELAPADPTDTVDFHNTLDTIGNAIETGITTLGNALQAAGKKYTGSSPDVGLTKALNNESACLATLHPQSTTTTTKG